MTSPVGAMLCAVLSQVSAGSEYAPLVDTEQRRRLLSGLFDSYYGHLPQDLIFDTNRMWCARLPTLLDLFPDAKIIACVRNVAWVMDSIERLHRKNPYDHTLLVGRNMTRSTVYNRLETLAQHDQLVGYAWSALREAFYSEYAERMLVVDYDLLAQAPHKVLPLIYEFIGEPQFTHDFEHVEYDEPDFDSQLGAPGLHKVQPKVEFKQRRTVIPPDLFEKYSQLTFWTDTNGSNANVIAPQPKPEVLL